MIVRPPQDESLNAKIGLRLTDAENEALRMHAKTLRTSPQEILRELARQWCAHAEHHGPTFEFAIVASLQAVAEKPAAYGPADLTPEKLAPKEDQPEARKRRGA